MKIKKENEKIEKEKKEEKKNKKVDIVDEFRKEFSITEDIATDKEIKKLLKENKDDKLKTYNNIMYNVLDKK